MKGRGKEKDGREKEGEKERSIYSRETGEGLKTMNASIYRIYHHLYIVSLVNITLYRMGW